MKTNDNLKPNISPWWMASRCEAMRSPRERFDLARYLSDPVH